MVNNSTNINKMNNYLSPQTIQCKTDHNIWHWKSKSWLDIVTKMGSQPFPSDIKLDHQQQYRYKQTIKNLWKKTK